MSSVENDNVFKHLDYRDYLSAWVEARSKGSRGLKKKLAEKLRCQSSFISQVLHHQSHLTLEHAVHLNDFLEHSSDEADYFLLLVQYQRAGNEELRAHFRKQMKVLQQKRLHLKNRIPAEGSMTDAQMQRYYSAWYFGAIRVLLTIPSMRTRDAIAKRLKLKPTIIASALDFLVANGLAKEVGGQYESTEKHLHLPHDSPLISKHHSNWRLKAMQSMEQEQPTDLHFSMALSLSQADLIKLKAKIVEYIVEIEKIIDPSPPEALACMTIDFFEIL
jgi:uncharacterized protein (TIGR02147 family)